MDELRANRERFKNMSLQKLVHDQAVSLYQPRKSHFQGSQMTLKQPTPVLSNIDQRQLQYQVSPKVSANDLSDQLRMSQLSDKIDGKWEEMQETEAREPDSLVC